MTVNELIEVLKCHPGDYKVRVYASYDDGFGTAGGEIDYVERNDYTNTGIVAIWAED